MCRAIQTSYRGGAANKKNQENTENQPWFKHTFQSPSQLSWFLPYVALSILFKKKPLFKIHWKCLVGGRLPQQEAGYAVYFNHIN